MSQYGAVNLGEALTSLAVIQVYAALAVTLVSVFAVSALGNLSKNYKKAAVTKLDYNAEASYVVPTKMLVALGSYYGLCQMFDKVKEVGDKRHAEAKAKRAEQAAEANAAIVDVGDVDINMSAENKEGTHSAAPTGMRSSRKQPGDDDDEIDIRTNGANGAANGQDMKKVPEGELDKVKDTDSNEQLVVEAAKTDEKTDEEELNEHRLSIIEEMFGGNDMDPALTKAVVHAGIDRLFCDGEVVLDTWEVDELTNRYFEYLGDPDDATATAENPEIGLKQFVQAFTQNEMLDFVGIHAQFDNDRAKPALERLFDEKYGPPKPLKLKSAPVKKSSSPANKSSGSLSAANTPSPSDIKTKPNKTRPLVAEGSVPNEDAPLANGDAKDQSDVAASATVSNGNGKSGHDV